MQRREFLIKLTVGGVAVPLVVTQLGCSDDDGGMAPNGGDESSCSAGGSFTSTSQPDGTGHRHGIRVACDDIETPPSSRTLTTLESGHTHDVTLTAADFDELANGGTVAKTSTPSSGHTHGWLITAPS